MRNLLCCVILLTAVAAGQQQPDPNKVQIKVTKVAGTVYMLENQSECCGNIAVSVGDNGMVVVDDEFSSLTGKIQALLKGISDKPVRFVINTHWHLDHVGANAYFQKQAPILAHENVRRRMATGAHLLGIDIKPAPSEALPIITFTDGATLHLNGEDIRIIHFPSGHTDGDSVVFFEKSNVVHMGDEFEPYSFPFVDLESGGGVRGMIAAVEKVLATVPPDTKVIPGHGPLLTVADLKPYTAMLKDCATRVQKGIDEGKTDEQLKKEKVLAGYESLGTPDKFVTTDQFIETLYSDLKRSRTGEVIKTN
jgi:cyclase